MPASRATPGERPRPATPTDVSAAIAERRRREQQRRTRMMAAGVAALALALVLVWVVRFSPLLAVRQVEVRGNSQVASADVVNAAQVPRGIPLVTVDSTAIGTRVVAALLPVAQVKVTTKLPGTVVIDVTERTTSYLRHAGDKYQWVDPQGVVFNSSAGPTKGALVAETSTVDNRLLADVATVVDDLPAQVRSRVKLVKADGPDQIVLQLDRGQSVVWGSAASSKEKAQVLVVLLTRSATVFDVSSPASPSTR